MSFRRGILLIICFTPSSSLTLSHTQTHTSLSAPCVPVNVHAAVKCSSNTVVASWDARPGALSYTGTLVGAKGFSTTCTLAPKGVLPRPRLCSGLQLQCGRH